MNKWFSLIVLSMFLVACEQDSRGYVQPDYQAVEEYDYRVKFLFEVDGVKMY